MKKIIDFLHSEQNIVEVRHGNDQRYFFCFHMAAAQTKDPEGIYLSKSPESRYKVTLQSPGDGNPDKQHVDFLLELVPEVYKL